MITENEAVIITDPCYILKDEDKNKEYYEISLFKNAICENNNYGDWQACVFKVLSPATSVDDLDNADMFPVSDFLADSGMVCCLKLKDVLKYNPNFISESSQIIYCIIPKGMYKGKIKWEYIQHYKPTQSAAIIGRNISDNEIVFIAKQTGA